MFNLRRFIEAQDPIYDEVCAELRAGHKRTHWMWYVFPQLRGLGLSEMAHYYGIESLDEAKAYLEHPRLGARHRVGKVVLHRADALLDEHRVLAVLHEVLSQLEQNILRPQRPEETAVSEFEDEVVEQRPVENVGVEEGGKAHSASSSARRFTSAGLPT